MPKSSLPLLSRTHPHPHSNRAACPRRPLLRPAESPHTAAVPSPWTGCAAAVPPASNSCRWRRPAAPSCTSFRCARGLPATRTMPTASTVAPS
uniref:Uncharacterized protein n=1 Tax=Triticum urartu TaxID=4572 RepID=A0A8R7PDM2_TRIUA